MHSRADIRGYPGSFTLLSEDAANTAVVFVHGFGGDSVGTWANFHAGVDMPDFADEFRVCDLFFYQYDSIRDSVEESAYRLNRFTEDIVSNVNEYTFRMWLSDARTGLKGTHPSILDSLRRHYDRFVFVGHSLGGVIIRRMVLSSVNGSLRRPRSHRRIASASLVLFAPAIGGFRQASAILELVSSVPFAAVGWVVWTLTRGGSYRDLVRPSGTLNTLKTETERLVVGDDPMPALVAAVYWAVSDYTVFAEKYGPDGEHREPDQDHRSICKPIRDFIEPLKWVVDGTQ